MLTNRNPKHKETDKAALIAIIQMAVNVELFTIPLYMSSMYSIKGFHQVTFGNKFDVYKNRQWPGIKPLANEVNENQKAFNAMFGIFIQEMFHLELVANISSAIGIKPCFTHSALQDGDHGWTCYGSDKTMIPGIVDLRDTTRYSHVKVNLGPLNLEMVSLMLAIEQPEEQAKSSIKPEALERYFPTVPFDGWSACDPLPLFGSIGHMYECLLKYACIKYSDDPSKTLFQILYEAAEPTRIQNFIFNKEIPPDHLGIEFPSIKTTFNCVAPEDSNDQLQDMVNAIVDQGEGHSSEGISLFPLTSDTECSSVYSSDFVYRLRCEYLIYQIFGIFINPPCDSTNGYNMNGFGEHFLVTLMKSHPDEKSLKEKMVFDADNIIKNSTKFEQKQSNHGSNRLKNHIVYMQKRAQRENWNINFDEVEKLLDVKYLNEHLRDVSDKLDEKDITDIVKYYGTPKWKDFSSKAPIVKYFGKLYLLQRLSAYLEGRSNFKMTQYDVCCWENFVFAAHQPDKNAMNTNYPSFDACGIKEPQSADAEARCDYARFTHYKRLQEIRENLCDIETWVDWHKAGNCWTSDMLETNDDCDYPVRQPNLCNPSPLPSTKAIAAAMNELKALRGTSSDRFDDLNRVAVGGIYGIVQSLREFWNKDNVDAKGNVNFTLPLGAMRASHGRMSIIWAVYGETPNLSLGIGNPDKLATLHNACQGLSFDNPGNSCAAREAYHTCAGANSCRTQGACGTVAKDCETLVTEPLECAKKAADIYSPPADNQCKSLGGCAVPISASQLLRVSRQDFRDESGKRIDADFTMKLYDFVSAANNPPNQPRYLEQTITFKQGESVYDTAWKAYTKVMETRSKDPGTKPETDLIRLVLAPV
ncbi:MAG: ferritin-like protein [Candidatus Thiothrix sulfatifontis]|nr:MAG: ferritin-like protein [Candidatus Thiothrix sulfatifontis]